MLCAWCLPWCVANGGGYDAVARVQYFITISVEGARPLCLAVVTFYARMAPFEDHYLGTVYRALHQAETDLPVLVDAV